MVTKRRHEISWYRVLKTECDGELALFLVRRKIKRKEKCTKQLELTSTAIQNHLLFDINNATKKPKKSTSFFFG